MLCVGVDVARSKPTDVVVLNTDLQMEDHVQCSTPKAVAGYVADLSENVWVAVDAPRRPNVGRMKDQAFRDTLSLPPEKRTYLNCRLVEYELGRRGLSCYFTPAGELTTGKKWMQVGFDVYKELGGLDFTEFRNQEAFPDRLMMEYYPYASFCALVGGYPGKKGTTEGRRVRVDALAQYGMRREDLAYLTTDGLDAAAGAVTAKALACGAGCWLGDAEEGFIVLPASLPADCRLRS